MIPNITHSTGSGRYLGYDLGCKKEQWQKVRFLAASGVILDNELIDQLNENWEDEESYKRFHDIALTLAHDLEKQFRCQAALNDRPKIKAINISFSYSPEDSAKVDEIIYDETEDDYVPLRLKMEREFLREMGFGGCQYFAVSHLGTHCPHDHFAINTILPDGKTINLKYDFVRAQKVAKDIREKYKLALPNDDLQAIKPRTVEALAVSCTLEEFEKNLRKYDIGILVSGHSKNGQGYGLSFTKNKKVIPGSKLDRNNLSYGKVMATLAKNLAMRNAKEEAKVAEEARRQEARMKAELRDKAISLRTAYKDMFPTLKDLSAVVNKTYTLYNDAKKQGVSINEQTTAKYNELRTSWKRFCDKSHEIGNAKTEGEIIKLLSGMLLLLNPIAGLLAIVIADLATDIRISRMQAEKKELLSHIQDIKTDIDNLKMKQSVLRLEKQELLQEYLQAKDARNEFREGMDAVKTEINNIAHQVEETQTVTYPSLDNLILGSIGMSDLTKVRQNLMFNNIVLKPMKQKDGVIASFKILSGDKSYEMNQVLRPSTILVLMKNWERLTGDRTIQTTISETNKNGRGPKGGGLTIK